MMSVVSGILLYYMSVVGGSLQLNSDFMWVTYR